MNDEIAGRQRLRLGQEVFRPPALLGTADQPVAQHVLFGDDRQALRLEPVLQRPDGQPEAALPLADVADVARGGRRGDPLVLQKAPEAFARTFGIGGDDNRAILQARFQVVGEGTEKADVFKLALGREIAPDAPAGIQNARPGGLRQGDKLDRAVPGDGTLPRRVVKVKKPRRAGLVDRIEPVAVLQRDQARLVLVGDPVPPREAGGRKLVVQHDRGAGQVVEQRLEPVVEERQPVFDTRVLAPRADCLVKRVVGTGGAELDPVGLAEPGDRGFVKHHLGHRGKIDGRQLFGRALGGGVEPARAVQHIAPKIEADRPARAGGKDVDDAAADRVVAGFGDGRCLRESHADQIVAQGGLVHAAADLRAETGRLDHLARGKPLGCGVQRRQKDERPVKPGGQRRQRRHALRRDLGVRGHPVVGHAIPGGKGQNRRVWREEGKGRAHRLHPLVVARDMDDRGAAAQFPRQKPGVETFGRARQGNMVFTVHRAHLSGPDRKSTRTQFGRTGMLTFWIIPQVAVTRIETTPIA